MKTEDKDKIDHIIYDIKVEIRDIEDNLEKRCNVIARTAKFGYNLLANKDIAFERVSGFTPEKLLPVIEDLAIAKESSTLPDKCPPEIKEEFENLLIELRIRDLDR